MEYRNIDALGVKTSLLGFGCMRFPVLADGKIDEPLSEKMIDVAYKAGVNYFDTAVPYHDGDSEPFVGRALKKYDRSSYYLATKLPPWKVNTLEDAKAIFEDQLQKMEKDYFDFYLLHALSKDSWQKFVDLGVVEYCEELKAQGKIRFLGFSFHDQYPVFEEIIRYKKWDFCQIQLNYMDIEEQAGMKGFELAASLSVPVIVMEPVKGGSLSNLPESLAKNFTNLAPDASITSWALRWVGTLPEVKVILSGMSSMAQLEDNLKTFNNFKPLNIEEQATVAHMAEELKKRVNNGCTECRYCMPCPAGVSIPANFHVWNVYGRYQSVPSARWAWEKDIPDSAKAKNCIQCGKCEEECPQKINIREDLKKVQAELDAICK